MKRVAIIGAGLAGTACAYVLKSRGFEPVIYEAGSEIAPGPSGNSIGLYNPRLSAEKTSEAVFYTEGFHLAIKTFKALKDIDWIQCGSLHLMTDEKRGKRFEQTVKNWGWSEDCLRIVDTQEASDIAGVEVSHKALWMKDAGAVSPAKLCARYAEGVEVKFDQTINSLEDVKADAVILACGMGLKKFYELPLKAVRGQITHVRTLEISKKLKSNLCYGGYMTPSVRGVHAVGATFQRWLDHSQIIEEDDRDNISKLAESVYALAGEYKVTGHRAAVRATTPEHFPIIGKLNENVYVSAGHGSHGIISSIMGAYIIADALMSKKSLLTQDILEKLSPARFSKLSA